MISQQQAADWSKQPDSARAKATHEAIRAALRGSRSLVQQCDFEDFLQGSYRNDTNIRGDSDVDIVVRLNSAWWYDTSTLSPFWAAEVTRTFVNVTYGFHEFRRDVLATLVGAFGSAVTVRNKCIEVQGRDGRLNADVVPCLYYRRYASSTAYDAGIAFETLNEKRLVINYPIQHYENGVAKNAATSGMFKPLVRLMKNARNEAVARRTLTDAAAPSYFVQCFVFNANNGVFVSEVHASFCRCISDLANRTQHWPSFMSENAIVPLFGPTPEQWNQPDAASFLLALSKL